MRAAAQAEPLAVGPVLHVVARLAARPADIRNLVLPIPGRVERRQPAQIHLGRVLVRRLRPARARHLFLERRVRDRARADTATRDPGRPRSAASTLSDQLPIDCSGSHIIRSRLMLSNPAARASANAAPARSAECSRPSRFNSASRNDWTPKLTRLTPAARNPSILWTFEVSGLVSRVTSASRRYPEGVAAGLDQPANFRRLEERRRAAPEIDGIHGLAAPAGANLALERRDVAILEAALEQPAVEIAVVADGRAERDVEVESEH